MTPTQTETFRPMAGCLNLDDLEDLAFRFGGYIEPHGAQYRLVDTVINGHQMTLATGKGITLSVTA